MDLLMSLMIMIPTLIMNAALTQIQVRVISEWWKVSQVFWIWGFKEIEQLLSFRDLFLF